VTCSLTFVIGLIGSRKTQRPTLIPKRYIQVSDSLSLLISGDLTFRINFAGQEAFDPYNADAGDGLFPNGSYVTPVPNQHNVYVPWNTTIMQHWLTGLVHKPTIVTIDNEMEIASNTHQDMHPA
jgi:hypothetical protein